MILIMSPNEWNHATAGCYACHCHTSMYNCTERRKKKPTCSLENPFLPAFLPLVNLNSGKAVLACTKK